MTDFRFIREQGISAEELKAGIEQSIRGEDIFFINNPALGLWALKVFGSA